MANAEIAETGQDVLSDAIEPPRLTPVDPIQKPPTIHEEMLASIARTGLVTQQVRIPLVSAETLAEGNARVQAEHGDDARRLLIIGPDAVAIGGVEKVIHIPGKRPAEMLGYLIALREVTRTREYFDLGLFDYIHGHPRASATSPNVEKLEAELRDANGDSLITRTGIRGGSRFGIDDVLVKDLRHSNAYEEARQLHSQGLFIEYILNGGQRPSMTEPAMARGARTALRSILGRLGSEIDDEGKEKQKKMSAEQLARYTAINEQQAAMHTSRQQVYEEAMRVENGQFERAYFRERLGETLEPIWQAQGACRGTNGRLHFPPPSTLDAKGRSKSSENKEQRLEREAAAKKVCDSCRVRDECLAQGLESVNLHSEAILGGKNKKERRKLAGAFTR